jgi:predicted aldo/keto reductase-like oxidoreductase
MIQFVDTAKDYEQIMQPGGLYELAARICKEGKARHIGISIHEYAVAEEAARSGDFDVIMYPLGIILAPIPKDDFFAACEQNRVGVVAMKPFGGGRLFRYSDSLSINPCRLIGFALLDSRVSTVIPGVKSESEMKQAIEGIETSPDPGEFAGYAAQLLKAGKGDCVYCNHCLPCPVQINIGEILMLLDWVRGDDSQETRDSYEKLPVKASACTACGVCETRCPFGVSVVQKMEEAAELFGS